MTDALKITADTGERDLACEVANLYGDQWSRRAARWELQLLCTAGSL